jgi:hypothetical protein
VKKLLAPELETAIKYTYIGPGGARPEFGGRQSKFELEESDLVLGQITYDV